MGAVVGLSGFAAAALNLLPICESTAIEAIKGGEDILVMGLVKRDEDCFHA